MRQAITNGTGGSTVLTADALDVLHALDVFIREDTMSADLTLSADCGPIMFSRTAQYDRWMFNVQPYDRIRLGELCLYFSGEHICDADGHTIPAGFQQSFQQTS